MSDEEAGAVPARHESVAPWRETIAAGTSFGKRVARFYGYQSSYASERRLVKGVLRPGNVPEKKDEERAEPGTNRKKGRADLLMWLDDAQEHVVIVEVKNTNWDRLARNGTVRRNALSHVHQVWTYLEGDLEAEPLKGATGTRKEYIDLSKKTRTAALIYPHVPATPGIRDEVEGLANDYGISVIWFDEAPPENSDAWRAWQAMQEGLI